MIQDIKFVSQVIVKIVDGLFLTSNSVTVLAVFATGVVAFWIKWKMEK